MTDKKMKTLGKASGACYGAAILFAFIASIVSSYSIMQYAGYSYFERNWSLLIIWAADIFLIVALFLDNLKLEKIAAGIVVLAMLFSPAGAIGGLIFRGGYSAFYFFTGLFSTAAAGLALAALLTLGKRGKILGLAAMGIILFNMLLVLVWGLLPGSISFVSMILMLNQGLFMALTYLFLALYVEEEGKRVYTGYGYSPAGPSYSAAATSAAAEAFRQPEEAPAQGGSFWSDDIQPPAEEENRNGAVSRE